MFELWFMQQNALERFLDTTENTSFTSDQLEVMSSGVTDSESTVPIATDNGVITLEIMGPLRKSRPSKMRQWIYNYLGIRVSSYDDIVNAVREIKGMSGVSKVRVVFDSPGGQVNGVDAAWQALSDLARTYDTEAVVAGMCCSAAYYLASALPVITSDAPINEIGSIGVLTVYVSWKKFDDRVGIKEFIITSSNAPNKAPDPESKEGMKVIQERIDALERVFYKRISDGRGVSTQDIAERFGQGGVLVSYDPDPERPDAVTVGMIDSVLGLDMDESETQTETTSEGSIMPTLTELMQSDGGIRAEVEARERAAVDKAKQSLRDQNTALVEKVAPFLGSEYPKAIHTLAIDVLKGESGFDALKGAATYHDSQVEAAKAAAAEQETEGTEETPPGAAPATPSEDGTVNNETDLAAVIEADRKRRGLTQ